MSPVLSGLTSTDIGKKYALVAMGLKCNYGHWLLVALRNVWKVIILTERDEADTNSIKGDWILIKSFLSLRVQSVDFSCFGFLKTELTWITSTVTDPVRTAQWTHSVWAVEALHLILCFEIYRKLSNTLCKRTEESLLNPVVRRVTTRPEEIVILLGQALQVHCLKVWPSQQLAEEILSSCILK